MKKIFDNKIVNGIIFFLETIAFIFLFLLLTLTCIQKFSKGGYFFGYQIYTVASSSMIPNYKVGDTLLIKKVPIEEIKVGDAVTYKGEDVTVKNLIINKKKYKAIQLYDWLYVKRIKSFDSITNMKKEVIERLKKDFYFDKIEIVAKQSDVDVKKYLLKLSKYFFISNKTGKNYQQ